MVTKCGFGAEVLGWSSVPSMYCYGTTDRSLPLIFMGFICKTWEGWPRDLWGFFQHEPVIL